MQQRTPKLHLINQAKVRLIVKLRQIEQRILKAPLSQAKARVRVRVRARARARARTKVKKLRPTG